MKALEKLNEKQLLKMATEKVWKENKDKINEKYQNLLKITLKKVLLKENVSFTYTYRANECQKYGTMSDESFKKFESILKALNYTVVYNHYDGKFTKEVDEVFGWNKDYYRSNIELFNYIFNTNFNTELYTDNLIYRQDIRAREKGISFILSEKARNFLKNAGYSIYKAWFNCGNGFKLPKFILF
jgi:putative uncharacterized protein FNV2255